MDENSSGNLEDLWDYLRNLKPEFHPVPSYCPDGDMIEVFWKEEACYGEQVNSFITLFRSQETNEVVGICIHKIIPIFGLDIASLIDMENKGYKNDKYYPKKMP